MCVCVLVGVLTLSVMHARCLLPCDHATPLTGVSCRIDVSSSPVSTFHIRDVWSAPAVASMRLLTSTSHAHTAPVCPLYVPRRSPVIASHTVGYKSFDVEKSRSPSLLYFTIVTARLCPWSARGLIVCCYVL